MTVGSVIGGARGDSEVDGAGDGAGDAATALGDTEPACTGEGVLRMSLALRRLPIVVVVGARVAAAPQRLSKHGAKPLWSVKLAAPPTSLLIKPYVT